MTVHSSDRPFRAAGCPFFYGWAILVLAAVGILMSAPGQTHGVAPFTDALIDALGLTRVQLSTAYMCGTIGSSLLLTSVGKLYDRLGARVVAASACVTLGLVLLTLSRCDVIARSLAGTLSFVSPATVAFAVIAFCFFLLRFSGQGVLTMASRNMMMKWFEARRGLVTGLTGMVMAPCFSATPIVMNWLVEVVGWREAWVAMGLVIGLGYASVVLVFYRDNPEACGLRPDGPLARRPGAPGAPVPSVRQYTLAEARRTYSFWVFSLSIAIFGLFVTGLSFHVASIFETGGMTREQGFAIFLPGAMVALGLRPIVGWLCDRIPLKYLLQVMLAGVAVASLGLLLPDLSRSTWLLILGNGLCGATVGSLGAVTWPSFYGREHMGAIAGLSMSITVFASAVGPWVFSTSRALSGSYRTSALLCLVATGVLLAASLRADSPRDRAAGPL